MQSTKFLVLASSSRSRLQLLKNIKIEPNLIIAPNVDESPLPKETVRTYCQRITKKKFDAAIEILSKKKIPSKNYIVITADTMAACGRRLLNKSYDPEVIRNRLKLIAGRRHKVFTSVCCGLIDNNELITLRQKTVMSILKFKRFNEKEIQELVDSKEGEGAAGNYSIAGIASKYLQFLSGSQSNVIGLPLYETSQMLTSLGYN